MNDLVVASLEPWDEVWRRNQHLVAELLRADSRLRVLFVEPRADPLHTLVTGRRPAAGAGLRPGPVLPGVGPGRLWLLQPTKALPRRVDPWSDRRAARSVVRSARRIRLHSPVLWVNDPSMAALLDATGWPVLYDITDDWLLADRSPVQHERLTRDEARLMKHAARVVVCSPTLARTKGGQRPVALVPNGVDLAAYQRRLPRPADLPAGPVALYAGTVHRDRIDVDLCLATAGALDPPARVVLLGPAPLPTADLDRLAAAGVLVLGPRPTQSVPAYLRHADVLLVPHIVTPFTESLDPIKRYEYQVAGRPVVSTPVAGFRDTGVPRVVVADGPDFVAAVRRELGRAYQPPPPPDLAVPGWADRARELNAVLETAAGRGAGDPAPGPRVAIAHDYLTQRGGAERVVLAMRAAFPDAPIYTTLYDPQRTYPEFSDARIVTSTLDALHPVRRYHRVALPVLPFIAQALRVDADVVLASSSGWAHGFRTDARVLVYCHAPARWIYQSRTYAGPGASGRAKYAAALLLRPWLRAWDRRAAGWSAHAYLANSRVVRERIHAAYGITAGLLPAPHTMDSSAPRQAVDHLLAWSDSPGYYLVVARLLPYKNVEAVVEAFRGLPERLVVVGDGPGRRALLASLPPNVRHVCGLSDAQVRWVYANARALVAASHEDYGLTPLEAAAFGKPTLAWRSGGYLDTVVEGCTGRFFEAPTAGFIAAAVVANRGATWDAEAIREHAAAFGVDAFAAALRERVATLWAQDQPTRQRWRLRPVRLDQSG